MERTPIRSAVADAIVAAATDPATRLHVPVGDDAAMYLGLFGQVTGAHVN